MLLNPKRTKYNKVHKGRCRGVSKNKLDFGIYGLKVKTPGQITARQLEAARKAIKKSIKRAGQLWVRIFPDVPRTKKPLEVRMGKGKGSVDHWVARVKKDQIIFELDGVNLIQAKQAFKLANHKLPLKTQFIFKN